MMIKIFMLTALYLATAYCMAQVPVSKEPRHHNVFENDLVRILDVHIPPKDTTQFHKHETPSVFIVLTPVKTGSQVVVEEKRATALSKDTAISFEGFYTKPRIHRVWNEDTTEFRVMDIELLNKNPRQINPVVLPDNFKLLFDERPVRGYRLTAGQDDNLQFKTQSAFLIVGLSDASPGLNVNGKLFSKKGDFIFINKNDTVRITNRNNRAYSFAALELK